MVKRKNLTYTAYTVNVNSRTHKKTKPFPSHPSSASNTSQSDVENHTPVNTGIMAATSTDTVVIEPSQMSEATTSIPMYQKRKMREVEQWSQQREVLYSAAIDWSNCPKVFECDKCCKSFNAITKCTDCGPQVLFCAVCCTEEHKLRPFHNIEIWNNHRQMFVEFLMERKLHTGCSCGRSPISVFVVGAKGMINKVLLCDCGGLTKVLVKNGVWPSSPVKPNFGFSFEFLDLYLALLHEGHVSVKSYIHAMCFKNGMDKQCATLLYKTLMTECLEEYKQYKRHINRNVSHNCFACPQEGAVISMDANFGLVHKRSSGYSYENPKHPWKVFIEPTVVEKYVCEHSTSSKALDKDTDCNSFQAGNKLRSKIKNKKLDATGIFGAICRHEVPLLFFDINQGERFAYPSLMIEHFVKTLTKPKIMYDVACNLEKYLKKMDGGEKLLESIELAIPIFHSYGHQTKCQLRYSPLRCEGFGLVDGEATERLWSYLRPFSKITKEMTPSHRQDLLTDALQYYSQKKKATLPEVIVQRLHHAEKVAQCSQDSLVELLKDYNVPVSSQTIELWQEEEKKLLLYSTKSKAHTTTFEENYVAILIKFNNISAEIESMEDMQSESFSPDLLLKQKEFQRKLETMERQNKITERWQPSSDKFLEAQRTLKEKNISTLKKKMLVHARERKFLCSLSRKYSDGQTIAAKLAKQIKSSTEKLKKILALHNVNTAAISLQAALDPSADFYNETHESDEVFPSNIKKQLIDLHYRQKRAMEEQNIVKMEMNLLLQRLFAEHVEAVEDLNRTSSLGLRALKQKQILYLEQNFKKTAAMFQCFINEIPDIKCLEAVQEMSPYDYLLPVDSEDLSDTILDTDDDSDDEDDVTDPWSAADSQFDSLFSQESVN